MGQGRQGSNKHRGPGRLMLGLVLAASLALSGCAGEGIFSMFGPKEPDIPQAPPGQYPSFTPTAPVARPPVLDAQGQAKMETDLEALAKQNQQKGEDAAKEVP